MSTVERTLRTRRGKRRHRAARRGGRRHVRAVIVVAFAIAATIAGAIGVTARAAAHVPPGATVAGVDVGGLPVGEAERRVAARAEMLARRNLRIVGPRGTIRTTAAELGARPRVRDAVAAAGRTRVGPIRQRLGVARRRAIPLAWELDEEAVIAAASRLGPPVPARDATVVVTASGARVRPAQPGRAVDVAALGDVLESLPASVRAPTVPVAPRVTTAAAREAARRADRLTGMARTVVAGNTRTRLDRPTLRALLEVKREGDRLLVGFDAERLSRVLPAPVAPRDARLDVHGTSVHLVPSAAGRAIDVAATAKRLAGSDAPTVVAAVTTSPPALATDELATLAIRRLVSEFTTRYPPGQPRVINIRRAAATIDGTILRPAETFSMNQALGERTLAKGYVPAPQILGNGYGDAVGGGISQVATTLYNAAFFAGLELVEHQPHTLYIDRYPLGREATISWGGPDLAFRNDWPAGVLIKIDTDQTWIRVRFFSSPLGRRVETETSTPYGHGGGSFSVTYTRRVYHGDRLRRNERYAVRYANGPAPAGGR